MPPILSVGFRRMIATFTALIPAKSHSCHWQENHYGGFLNRQTLARKTFCLPSQNLREAQHPNPPIHSAGRINEASRMIEDKLLAGCVAIEGWGILNASKIKVHLKADFEASNKDIDRDETTLLPSNPK